MAKGNLLSLPDRSNVDVKTISFGSGGPGTKAMIDYDVRRRIIHLEKIIERPNS